MCPVLEIVHVYQSLFIQFQTMNPSFDLIRMCVTSATVLIIFAIQIYDKEKHFL